MQARDAALVSTLSRKRISHLCHETCDERKERLAKRHDLCRAVLLQQILDERREICVVHVQRGAREELERGDAALGGSGAGESE